MASRSEPSVVSDAVQLEAATQPQVRPCSPLSDLDDFHSDPSTSLKTPDHLIEVVKANAANSPFLRLPAELRNRIYDFALPMQEQLIYPRRGRAHRDLINTFALQLPTICRQVYSETAFTIYANNHFAFHSPVDPFSFLESRNNAQRAMMSSVTIYGRGRDGYLFMVEDEMGGLTLRPKASN